MIQRKIPFLLGSAVFAAVLLASCSHAPTKTASSFEEIPFVGSLKAKRTTLPNGLKLIVVEDHSSPTFAYQTWFKVGSRNEVAEYTGLAHLFEHLMFKGTTLHPGGDYMHVLEQNGKENLNAFTSRDYTAYVQDLPNDKLDLVASLESDRMHNLIVDDKSFTTEREVVQNERRLRTENSPDGMMFQELYSLAFQKSPYHWPVIGYEEDLKRMTSSEPRAFYLSYYTPNHATIIVVGDVDAENVLEVVKKHYGSLEARNPPTHDIVVEPPQTEARIKTIKMSIQVQKFAMGVKVPGVMDQDIPALTVLQTILAGGHSSRLSRALVDTGMMSSIDTSNIEDEDPTFMVFVGSMQKGKSASDVEKVILREFERLKSGGISQKELERAKNQIAYDFYEGLDTSEAKANFIGRYETISDRLTTGFDIFNRSQRLSAADVLQVAKKYLRPETRTTILGVQK